MKPPCHDVRALYQAGASINEIMRLTGYSRQKVEYRLFYANERKNRHPRACLRCGRVFQSEGPHNRLCDRCREAAADLSPYTPDIT